MLLAVGSGIWQAHIGVQRSYGGCNRCQVPSQWILPGFWQHGQVATVGYLLSYVTSRHESFMMWLRNTSLEELSYFHGSIKSFSVHSLPVTGCMYFSFLTLCDPLRTCAIPERLRGVFTMRRYTNTHLPYLTCRIHTHGSDNNIASGWFHIIHQYVWYTVTPLLLSCLRSDCVIPDTLIVLLTIYTYCY